MSDGGTDVPGVRGYVVLREDEPGLWKLIGDVDYQQGLAARAARVQAVTDALGGSAPENGTGYAALPRDQWHEVRHD